jgi:hypothetical protein
VPKRGSPGWQSLHSELAIGFVLTLRLVSHLALRQAKAFGRSALCLLGAALPVLDHTTLSRRGQAFAGCQHRVLASAGPIHLVLDGTGLKLSDQGGAGQGSARAASEIPAEESGMPRSMAEDADSGASLIPPSKLTTRARSQRKC